jgi:hypothetical protein
MVLFQTQILVHFNRPWDGKRLNILMFHLEYCTAIRNNIW